MSTPAGSAERPPGADIPTVAPGLTLLDPPGPRSTALHQVALATASERAGPVYWIDARNTASTYTLHSLASTEAVLSRVRIARAFTAYQHVSLVERVVNTVSPRTGMVVVPNVASLYRDDDVPAHEAEPLVDAVLGALEAVTTTYEIPVLLSDAGPADELRERLNDHVETHIACERTALGYRFEGPDIETTVYWQDGAWQTTIPYWVELVGAVHEEAGFTIDAETMRVGVEG